jgi:transposase
VIRAVEEQLLPFLVRPTVLLLDNAALHRCKRIKQKLKAWKASGLHIWFLPPYRPHLNLMEVVWKQVKHHRLQPADYADFQTLCASVSKILNQLNRKMLHYFCPNT